MEIAIYESGVLLLGQKIQFGIMGQIDFKKKKYYYQKINSEIAVRVQLPQPPTQRTELNPKWHLWWSQTLEVDLVVSRDPPIWASARIPHYFFWNWNPAN